MSDVRTLLKKRPLLFDGGMGHTLPEPGLLPVGHCGKGFRAGVWQHQHLQCSAR